jgi:hypothetical protein
MFNGGASAHSSGIFSAIMLTRNMFGTIQNHVWDNGASLLTQEGSDAHEAFLPEGNSSSMEMNSKCR